MAAFSATATLLVLLLVVLGGVSAEPRTVEEVLGESGSLEEKALVLEASKVPIHFEVKKQADSGKKHVELYYYDESGERKKLAELLPLDLSAFIGHKLAKEDDELNVEFTYPAPPYIDADRLVSAYIYRKSAGIDKARQYSIRIRQAGGIGYVRLPEVKKLEGTKVAENMVFPQMDNGEKLYYVRVPISLFPQLDGEALQEKAGVGPLRGYTIDTCYHVSPAPHNTFSCLVLKFEWHYLATVLYGSNTYGVHSIATAKAVAKIVVRQDVRGPSLFVADPKLATDSHVYYVVMADLQTQGLFNQMDPKLFHRMEPQFVEKYGQLVAGRKPRKKPDREEVELLVEKDGKKSRVAFPLRPCKHGYCLRTDEVIGEQPHGMGVTYVYETESRRPRTLEPVLRECERLEEKVEECEARKVPIHVGVKKQANGGKKHLELYYRYEVLEESGERKKFSKPLAELLPLDLYAFIERGLAKEDDVLKVNFSYTHSGGILTARIRPKSGGVGKERNYTISIRQAAGISYVRLSEARMLEGGRAMRIAFPQVGSEEEEKLYYVRSANAFKQMKLKMSCLGRV